MTTTALWTDHPAPYSDKIMPVLRELLDEANEIDTMPVDVVVDPFAGTGRIHELRPDYTTWGVELEPEGANMSPFTACGNALDLSCLEAALVECDAFCTSPTYANRMADKHNARDDSKRHTYKHSLGRDLTPGNTGGMQWGYEYRDFHKKFYVEADRVLRDGGWFVLNIKDSLFTPTKGAPQERRRVVSFHLNTLQTLNYVIVDVVPVTTPGQRNGANGKARVDAELVFLLRKF